MLVLDNFIFFVILLQPGSSCEDGDVRLVAGATDLPLEGRVEICLGGWWGTVCGTDWDDNDAAVVCRQLGFPSGGMALSSDYVSGMIGRGRGFISLYDVSCAGDELVLSNCNSSSIAVCDHADDVGVRCSYTGPPILVLNGRRYLNNSIVDLQEIGPGNRIYNASLYCLTNYSQCCSDSESAAWHIPEGLDLSNHRNYEYFGAPTQSVNLYRPRLSYISGVFFCSILDRFAAPAFLYVGIYQRGLSEFWMDIIGRPSILSFTYNKESHTLSCLSTGGPATTVLWTKDFTLLTVDGAVYEQSQVVLNTGLATYDNKLTIKSDNQMHGLYECLVGNIKGIVSAELRVPVCNDGDAFVEDSRKIQICQNGSYYNFFTFPSKVIPASTAKPDNAPPTGAANQQVKSSSSSSVTAVLGGFLGLFLIVVIILAVLLFLLFRRRNKNKYLVSCRNPACMNYNHPGREDMRSDITIATYVTENPVIRVSHQDHDGNDDVKDNAEYDDVIDDESYLNTYKDMAMKRNRSFSLF